MLYRKPHFIMAKLISIDERFRGVENVQEVCVSLADALNVAMGEQRVVFVPFSAAYIDSFVADAETMEMRNIRCARLLDSSGRWHVDVALAGIDVVFLHPESRAYMRRLGFHAFDDLIDSLEGTDPDDAEPVFALRIDKVTGAGVSRDVVPPRSMWGASA